MDCFTFFPQAFWDTTDFRISEGQRYGQAVFDTAVQFYEEAEQLAGSSVDCFHRDENVESFLISLTDLLTTPKRTTEDVLSQIREYVETTDDDGPTTRQHILGIIMHSDGTGRN